MKRIPFIFLFLFLLVSSCLATPNPESPSLETNVVSRTSVTNTQTPLPTVTPSKTPEPTFTLSPTLTPLPPTYTPTPYEISHFSGGDLYPGVSPVAYIDDICPYLENRWGEGKSNPGTIVVPIMFHSVAKPGRVITDSTTISTAYFEFFMDFAKEMGFSTITINDLIGFLKTNEKIPERSMILILDDRRPGVTELFMPYLEENDWTLTLAWPTTDGTGEGLWAQMEALALSGRLDIQSHGHDHIYIQDYTPMEEIEEEIYQPIEVIQEHFNTIPKAIIWPGGNFTQASVDMAAEAGFEVGFTVYSRGPLMFNWIPLGVNEKAMKNPMMVLPRYWSTAADVALIDALEVSEAAQLEANAVKTDEMLYYETYCQPLEND